VLECVDALGTLAEFNCMVGHGRDAAVTVAEHLENFLDVGLWYRKRRIVRAVTKACEEGLRECYEQNKIEFRPGLTSLKRSVRKMRRKLIKEQPSWRHELRRLDHMLES